MEPTRPLPAAQLGNRHLDLFRPAQWIVQRPLILSGLGGNGGSGGNGSNAATGTATANITSDSNLTVEADANSTPTTPGNPFIVRQAFAAGGNPTAFFKHRRQWRLPGKPTASATGTSTQAQSMSLLMAHGGPGGNAGSAPQWQWRQRGAGVASATGVNAGSNIVQVTANAVGWWKRRRW